jgi:hypothetical protein
VPLAWVPYADRAEAERRLGGVPAGIELDFYRADGDKLPGTIDEVAFYVLPYMKGPSVLDRAADMPKLRVVQTLPGCTTPARPNSPSPSPWPAAGTWTTSPVTRLRAPGGSSSAGPWPTSGS